LQEQIESRQQELLTNNNQYYNLQICYNKESDDYIKKVLEKEEDDSYEDYELVDTGEFESADFEEFKVKYDNDMRSSTTSKLTSLWDPKALLKSNYFSDSPPVKQSVEKNISKSPKKPTIVKAPPPLESEESKEILASSVVSSEDSLESDEDTDQPRELIGTLYFMEPRGIKPKDTSFQNRSEVIPKRRLSGRGSSQMIPNPLLEQSIAASELVKEQNFTEGTWKELFGFFQHKALILRCFANVLKICLPYPIDEEGLLINGKNRLTLIPSVSVTYEENFEAYRMLRVDMVFIYKSVKQLSRAQQCHYYIDFVAKLCI